MRLLTSWLLIAAVVSALASCGSKDVAGTAPATPNGPQTAPPSPRAPGGSPASTAAAPEDAANDEEKPGRPAEGGGGQPVPEPATLLLLGTGLVGAAWYGRRRRRPQVS